MNIHQNARLTPQGRLLLVERITEAGWSVEQAAQAAGISVRLASPTLSRVPVGRSSLRDNLVYRVDSVLDSVLAAQSARC
jgi:hypothetical protein